MKKQFILVLVVSAFLAGCGAGNLDQGQVKYTPGVPPWQEKDPAKKGPGAAPQTQPTPDPAGQNTTDAPPGGGPPGMTPPERGMGKS